MPRLAAFLRGINLGNRRVKMADLRRHLEVLGLEGVATLRASGNVVFDHAGGDRSRLEGEIEAHLEEALGFDTATFVRPVARLREIVELDEVAEGQAEGFRPYVVFARDELDDVAGRRLAELETPEDRFLVLGAELLWLRRGGIADTSVSTRDLEAALGTAEHTRRNLSTVRKIVEKHGG